MRDRFGATNPKAQALRFHAQTGGSTLTAQQPENNIVRVAIQALSAVCGGAQSLHTNGFDEALALPTEHAAQIALRTQQILRQRGGTTDTADPLGGAYFVEALTRELEERARELIERIDELGGAVAAIEEGFVQGEIEDAAFAYAREVEAGERVIVGVNAFANDGEEHRDRAPPPRPGARAPPGRAHPPRAGRARRGPAPRRRSPASARPRAATANLLHPMREALAALCTVGEICDVLREEFGTYDAQRRDGRLRRLRSGPVRRPFRPVSPPSRWPDGQRSVADLRG